MALYVNQSPAAFMIGLKLMTPGEPFDLDEETLKNGRIQELIRSGVFLVASEATHKDDAPIAAQGSQQQTAVPQGPRGPTVGEMKARIGG